jgi:transcriptional regulator of acetoin/glycerol metabolism
MDAMASHGWPGNVRELENVIHRTLLVSSGLELTLEDLPPGIGGDEAVQQDAQPASAPGIGTGSLNLEELERETIIRALELNKGNLSDVARQLGIGRSTLYRKLEQFGLRERK